MTSGSPLTWRRWTVNAEEMHAEALDKMQTNPKDTANRYGYTKEDVDGLFSSVNMSSRNTWT